MLQRGFKSWSENIAIRYREELDLQKLDPLDAMVLAAHLQIPLITPDAIDNLSSSAKNILLHEDPDSWSAVTLHKNGKHFIIYNSSNAPSRRSNDIMHELSHIIIGHKPQKDFHSPELNVIIRDYNSEQEDEANCLASTLLLPKDALLNIKFKHISDDVAAKKYCVSKTLLKMRLNLSGVNYIHQRASKKYHNE
ncbi:MAG: ImmA/IrrE family metallo-endopeptidase [Chitinispirillaceae bacterium]|jgi:Zn-dependent peptidase ImmA (M78 family)